MLLGGMLLSALGALILWRVVGGEHFTGNVGRTMDFTERLAFACAILAAGLALIALARRSANRLAARVRKSGRSAP